MKGISAVQITREKICHILISFAFWTGLSASENQVPLKVFLLAFVVLVHHPSVGGELLVR